MRVVVTGAGGQLGREVSAVFPEAVALDRAALDVGSPAAVAEMVDACKPDVIVHCAAYTDVDGCERDPEHAMKVNAADLSAADDAFIVYVSTDYVFDGTQAAPYLEHDTPNPLSAYGRSKLAGERLLDAGRHAIVRTSFVQGRYGKNLVHTILRLHREGVPLRFVTDQRTNPTVAADLAQGLRAIVAERRAGVWHMTNQGTVTPFEFAQEVVKAAGGDPSVVEPVTTADLPPRPAPRPANAVLASERLRADELLPDFRTSLPGLLVDL